MALRPSPGTGRPSQVRYCDRTQISHHQVKAMSAIGAAWVLEENIAVPKVIFDVVKALQGGIPKLDDIKIKAYEDDPSAQRDVTDPIYTGCWWRGEVAIGGGDIYDSLSTFYFVSPILPEIGLPTCHLTFIFQPDFEDLKGINVNFPYDTDPDSNQRKQPRLLDEIQTLKDDLIEGIVTRAHDGNEKLKWLDRYQQEIGNIERVAHSSGLDDKYEAELCRLEKLVGKR
jgi:hypothetical protein